MRKKFLVKPSLQFRHLAWTLGLVLLSCVSGYFLFESLAGKLLQTLPVASSDWIAIRSLSRLGFTLILFILLIAVGIENYLLFHKFVGPLFALEKGLKRIAAGDLTTSIHVRDSDELSELVSAFEDMRKELLTKLGTHEKLSTLLSEATPSNIHELREQISKLRDQIKKEAA